MKLFFSFIVFSIVFPTHALSQKKEASVQATSSQIRQEGYKKRVQMESNGYISEGPVRCIGPTVMSGRVVDIEVDPKNPSHFYVAYASGGLWVTHNNGTTFDALFQNEMVMTIGDIAVDWNNGEIIWIGSGENNSSRSSYSGFGVYRSVDLGKSWKNLGLTESHHIGRIILHPENPAIAWVAVLGHLYSESPERGVYKTVDAGKTWNQYLDLGANTGAIDLAIDPNESSQLYCSTWGRTRMAWNFVESGSKSAIHQSMDGGVTWKNISTSETGFPNGEGVGRIGISTTRGNDGFHLYALLDNQFERPKSDEEKKDQGLKKSDFSQMTIEKFGTLNDSLLNKFLLDNNFPKEHTSATVKKQVKEGKLKPSALSDYLYDANSDLFDRPVIGAEVYKYNFESKTWLRTHADFLDDVFYSYGYYFSQIRVHPLIPQKLYIMGVPLLTSDDGGATWRGINPDNVHVDHHALWINPKIPGHIINGSDGGVQISYDDGKTFINCNTPAVGQFYSVQVDNEEPYNVYGGLQDNGVWVGPSDNKPGRDWYQSGKYPFEFLMGGDGMQVQVDTRNNNTVYTGYQFGNYERLNRKGDYQLTIHPAHTLGETPLRWNWQTPILLSKHQQDIFYICSNKVHRSLDRGENMETLSGDLTKGGRAGDVPYGTLTSISESPLRFGWLVVGSDDGLVHISRDNGYTWENISKGLPENFWVSRVVFSKHKIGRIYVALNGYRSDNFAAHIFRSDDFGKTWSTLSSSLPMEPVNVVIEDPRSENILYSGTDHGLYVSRDMGVSWRLLFEELPSVAIHDLVIQEREMDLVIGTHGRSIWIADIEHLAAMDTIDWEKPYVFSSKPIRKSNWGENWSKWLEPDLPDFYIPTFVPMSRNSFSIEVWYMDSIKLANVPTDNLKWGFRNFTYDLSITKENAELLVAILNKNLAKDEKPIEIKEVSNGKYYLAKGTYKILFKSGLYVAENEFVIE